MMRQKHEDQFRRRVIATSATWMGIVIFGGLIPRQLISPMPRDQWFFPLSMACLMMLVPWLMRKGMSTLASAMVLMLGLFLIAIYAGLNNGGMKAPATVSFVVLPLLGFLLNGKRGAKIAVFLSLIGMAVLILAENIGLAAPLQRPERFIYFKTMVYCIAIGVVYAIGAAYERSRSESEIKADEAMAQITQSSKMASLGEMAAGIAHEINNPLTIIHTTSTMVRRKVNEGGISPEKLIRDLETLESTALRISKIINGLRTFSRNADEDPMSMVPVSQVVDDTLALCFERFRHHRIELTAEGDLNLRVQGRAVQLTQVLMNLLGNSFDAIEFLQERWVRIYVSQQKERVIISVTDSGKGIPSEVAEKIMHPFFTTKDLGKGTGLGLSISMGIIRDHQGSLKYDPTSEHTRFVIDLPLSV